MRPTPLILFAVGYTLSIVGSGFVSVALSFAVFQLGGHAREVGFVLAAQAVPPVILLLGAGVIADRLPRRRVMIGADLARAASEAVLAFLLLRGHASLTALALLSGALGAGNAFFLPAYTGFVTQLVAPERLMAANSMLGICASVGGVLGPALGGLLVGVAGPGWAIAVDAVSFLASATCLLAIRVDRPLPRSNAGSALRQLAEGWSDFRSRTWLWVLVSLAAIWCLLVNGPVIVLGAAHFAHSPGGASAWGGLLGIMCAGEVVGGMAMTRIKPRYPLRFALVVFLFAAPMPAAIALGASFAWCGLVLFVGGLSIAIFGVVWTSTMQTQIPEDRLSRVSAWDHVGSVCLLPIGLAIAAPMGAVLGAAAALWLATAYGAFYVVGALAVPDIRNLTETRGRSTVPHDRSRVAQ